MSFAIKSLFQKLANRFGYRIEKVRSDIGVIDLLGLVLQIRIRLRGADFFFVQVGANDGVTDDPISSLVQQYHLRGIAIEPLPAAFARLQETYRLDPQVQCVNVAVAPTRGLAPLYVSDGRDNLCSFRRDVIRRRVGSMEQLRVMEVPTCPLEDLLGQHNVRDVDLLQVDAEGYDHEVLKTVDYAKVRPAIIHFEHINLNTSELGDCIAMLNGMGYKTEARGIDTLAICSRAFG